MKPGPTMQSRDPICRSAVMAESRSQLSMRPSQPICSFAGFVPIDRNTPPSAAGVTIWSASMVKRCLNLFSNPSLPVVLFVRRGLYKRQERVYTHRPRPVVGFSCMCYISLGSLSSSFLSPRPANSDSRHDDQARFWRISARQKIQPVF